MIETTVTTEKRIKCQERNDLLLARVSPAGLLLWCRWHKCEHLVTWQQLATMQQDFQPVPCIPTPSSVH